MTAAKVITTNSAASSLVAQWVRIEKSVKRLPHFSGQVRTLARALPCEAAIIARMEPLKIAILGLGQAARNIHLPALRGLGEQFEAAAVCDPDEAAREAAQAAAPGAKIYADPYEAIRGGGIDAVDICSPPALHCEQACAALAAGLHVFCEKPLAMNLGEADRMLAAAGEARRTLAVNGQFPDMAIHQAAHTEIASPRFGRLLLMQATQSFRTSEATEAGWRNDAPRRVTFDFGVHLFDLSTFFFGELPASVSCTISSLGTPIPEAATSIALAFPSGGAASFVLNRVSAGEERYCDIVLTGVDSEARCSIGGRADLEFGIAARSRMPYARARFAMGGTAERVQAGRSQLLAREGSNPFAAATAVRLRAFYDQIQRDVPMPRSAAYHREMLALALAAYESAETGRRIDMAGRYAPASAFCR
jgi:predicted dehydrogenase